MKLTLKPLDFVVVFGVGILAAIIAPVVIKKLKLGGE
jgi:hypothetical protein